MAIAFRMDASGTKPSVSGRIAISQRLDCAEAMKNVRAVLAAAPPVPWIPRFTPISPPSPRNEVEVASILRSIEAEECAKIAVHRHNKDKSHEDLRQKVNMQILLDLVEDLRAAVEQGATEIRVTFKKGIYPLTARLVFITG